MTDGMKRILEIIEPRIVQKLREPEGTEECWQWKGAMSRGVPKISEGRTSRGVAGKVWKKVAGGIQNYRESGKVSVPLCRNSACVNPWHRDHVVVSRGKEEERKMRRRARHLCREGHPMRGRNLYVQRGRGSRCRLCMYRYLQRYYNKRGAIRMIEKLERGIAGYRGGDLDALGEKFSTWQTE